MTTKTNKPPITKPKWEIEFDKEIICHCDDSSPNDLSHTISNPDRIKSFISDLLKQQKQKLLKKINNLPPRLLKNRFDSTDTDNFSETYTKDHVISLIQEEHGI